MPTHRWLLLTLLTLPLATFGDGPPASPATPTTWQVTMPSGLQYNDVAVGKGFYPQLGHEVTVHYVGMFEDGRKFDSSRDRNAPFTFQFGRGGMIPGWDQCVATMKTGGRRLVHLPPELGYGRQGYKDIPPNTPLVFDIEVLSIK